MAAKAGRSRRKRRCKALTKNSDTKTLNIDRTLNHTTRKGEKMKMPQRRFRQIMHWKSRPPFYAVLLIGVLLAGPAGAAPGDKFDVLRDLATRVGAVVG